MDFKSIKTLFIAFLFSATAMLLMQKAGAQEIIDEDFIEVLTQNSKEVLKHNRSMDCKVYLEKFHNWLPSRHFQEIQIRSLT